jgi:hypothetical protein
MHVAPDARVFMSGPEIVPLYPGDKKGYTWLLNTNTGEWSECGKRKVGLWDYGPSVMYDVGKVIYIGGGVLRLEWKPTNAAEIIDLNQQNPQWTQTDPMKYRRRQHNATILADGTVLVTGGTQGGGPRLGESFNNILPGQPVHEAELWDPETRKWTTLASETVDRCYHSTAVLLPDATVLSAGGGEYEDEKRDFHNYPNKPRDEYNFPNGQVFKPPYLFRGARPKITLAPGQVKYEDEEFRLTVSETPKIEKVTWVRLSSVTHTNNQNQRINFLQFKYDSQDKKTLIVTPPKKPEICPPGHYMLFAISERTTGGDLSQAGGVPSEAKIIRIVSTVSTLPVSAPAEAERDTKSAAAYTEELDEAITAAVTGSGWTPVTVGVTPQCLYGLGPCWAGAYGALRALSGVAEVRPIPNAQDSTAEVYLGDEGLPVLDRWPEEFAQAANGNYEFRSVEVTITGTVQQRNGTLHLTVPSADNRPSFDVKLESLERGVKVQWDSKTRQARPATPGESAAYQAVEARYRDYTAEAEPMRVSVIGPLAKPDTEWILYVRVVEPVES